MSDELSLQETKAEWHGTFKSYVIGLIGSLVFTGTSFLLVIAKPLSHQWLMYTLVGLAGGQAVFQLLYFLHLGQEAKPRWETLIFYFMVLILLIIAIGSLWIMNDLNNRMMMDMTLD